MEIVAVDETLKTAESGECLTEKSGLVDAIKICIRNIPSSDSISAMRQVRTIMRIADFPIILFMAVILGVVFGTFSHVLEMQAVKVWDGGHDAAVIVMAVAMMLSMRYAVSHARLFVLKYILVKYGELIPSKYYAPLLDSSDADAVLKHFSSVEFNYSMLVRIMPMAFKADKNSDLIVCADAGNQNHGCLAVTSLDEYGKACTDTVVLKDLKEAHGNGTGDYAGILDFAELTLQTFT